MKTDLTILMKFRATRRLKMQKLGAGAMSAGGGVQWCGVGEGEAMGFRGVEAGL